MIAREMSHNFEFKGLEDLFSTGEATFFNFLIEMDNVLSAGQSVYIVGKWMRLSPWLSLHSFDIVGEFDLCKCSVLF